MHFSRLALFNFIFIFDTIRNAPISSLFNPLHPASPFPLAILCLRAMHTNSLANPFIFFHPVPSPPPPLTAVSLFPVWDSTLHENETESQLNRILVFPVFHKVFFIFLKILFIYF